MKPANGAAATMLRSTRNNTRKRAFRRRGRIRRVLLFVVGPIALVVGSYTLAGFYGGSWLLDRWLGGYLPGGPASAGAERTVRFNPFTLVAEIVALEIEDPATGATFAADRIVADLAAISLAQRRPVFRSVLVEQPRIVVASLADLSMLGRIARTSPLDRSRLDDLELQSGTLAAGLGTSAPLELTRFDASLTGLDAGSGAAGRLRFDAVTASGVNVESEGSLAANLERSDGQLRLDALELGTAATGLGRIAAGAPRGRLDLSAGYSATSLLTRPRLDLAGVRLDIPELSLMPADGLTVGSNGLTAAGSLTLEAAAAGLQLSGRIEADGARVVVHDARATPPQSFVVTDAAVLVTAEAGDGDLSLSLNGALDGAGAAMVSVRLPPAVNAGSTVSIEAAELPAARLSAYAVGALNRPLATGSTDLGLDYSVVNRRIDGSLHLVARNLGFTSRLARETGDSIDQASLELAAALLETPDGAIELDLPFTGNTGSARDAVTAALGQRVARLADAPFEALAPLIGRAADANAVVFRPGDAALGEAAITAVRRLAGALMVRPRLGVRVLGGYDAAVDRDELARQQVELHVQLATADPSARNRPAPVDLDSARVQDVLDEFATERLPDPRVADLAARYECRDTQPCRRAYYAQIFDALVANEEIAPSSLSRLGRFRAQSVAEALAMEGIDPERIEVTTGAGIAATASGVALPVELTARRPETD